MKIINTIISFPVLMSAGFLTACVQPDNFLYGGSSFDRSRAVGGVLQRSNGPSFDEPDCMLQVENYQASLADSLPQTHHSVVQGITQSKFSVPFEFFSEESLSVYVDSVLQVLNKDYTVSGGNGSTGSVTISVTGASGGSTVVISLERKEADAAEVAQCVREVEALRIQQREVATTTVVTTPTNNLTPTDTPTPNVFDVFREIFTPNNAPTPNNNPTSSNNLTSSSPTVQTISQDEVRSNISDRTGSDAGGFEFDDVTNHPSTDINLEPEPPRSVSSFLRRIFSGNTTSELDIADPPSGTNPALDIGLSYNNIHITPHVTDDDAATKDPAPAREPHPTDNDDRAPANDTTPTKDTTPAKDTTPTKEPEKKSTKQSEPTKKK